MKPTLAIELELELERNWNQEPEPEPEPGTNLELRTENLELGSHHRSRRTAISTAIPSTRIR